MMRLEQLLAGSPVEWRTLGEVGTFYGGLSGKTRKDFAHGSAAYIPYRNIFGNPELDPCWLETVDVADSERQHAVQYGDVLFTASSETADEVGMSSVVTTRFARPVYLNSFSFGFRFHAGVKILPAFSKHLFRGQALRRVIVKTANGTIRYNVSRARFRNIMIPLPSLAMQTEIVRILDAFTKLEAELEAELEGRMKQYAYYMDQLLSFGEDEVEWCRLEDVFELRGGYTPLKSNRDFWDGGTIPWYRMEDIRANGRILHDAIQHVTPRAVKGRGLFEANSIIMATTATIGEHALLTADSLANQQFTNFKIRGSLKSHLSPRFAYYYFYVLGAWCRRNVHVGAFPSVKMESLRAQPFPIPPLARQAEIVCVLDRLHALSHSLMDGLPAELRARRKQYEHYRERLLTFPGAPDSLRGGASA